jgi:group I intron endonuclease
MIYGYVYLITNLVNGKRYVGCHCAKHEATWSRPSAHFNLKDRSGAQLIQSAIGKYGAGSFRTECLEVFEGSDTLEVRRQHVFERENHWIQVLGTLVGGHGYNLRLGMPIWLGRSSPLKGRKQTEEHRRRHSQVLLGKKTGPNLKLRVPHSPERAKKAALAQVGVKRGSQSPESVERRAAKLRGKSHPIDCPHCQSVRKAG